MSPYQQPYGQYGYYGPPGKSDSSGLIWVIAIIAILVLAAGGIGIATKGTFDFTSLTSSGGPSESSGLTEPTEPSTTETSTPSEPAGLTATADELITAYTTDNAAADTKYKGKTVTVTGKLESYMVTTYTVILKGDTAADYSISCEFNETDIDKILSLEPEQSLKISGTLDGLTGGEIKLTVCSFVQ